MDDSPVIGDLAGLDKMRRHEANFFPKQGVVLEVGEIRSSCEYFRGIGTSQKLDFTKPPQVGGFGYLGEQPGQLIAPLDILQHLMKLADLLFPNDDRPLHVYAVLEKYKLRKRPDRFTADSSGPAHYAAEGEKTIMYIFKVKIFLGKQGEERQVIMNPRIEKRHELSELIIPVEHLVHHEDIPVKKRIARPYSRCLLSKGGFPEISAHNRHNRIRMRKKIIDVVKEIVPEAGGNIFPVNVRMGELGNEAFGFLNRSHHVLHGKEKDRRIPPDVCIYRNHTV